MQKKTNDIFNGFEDNPSSLYVLLGVVFIAAHIALCAYTEISPTLSGLIAILLYTLICGISYIIGSRERPYPVIKSSTSSGSPSGESKANSYEVRWTAIASPIPCAI